MKLEKKNFFNMQDNRKINKYTYKLQRILYKKKIKYKYKTY